MKKGRPYNPISQGVVERIHSTIRKALLCMFIENPNDFDLKNDLQKIMRNYKNFVHKSA